MSVYACVDVANVSRLIASKPPPDGHGPRAACAADDLAAQFFLGASILRASADGISVPAAFT